MCITRRSRRWIAGCALLFSSFVTSSFAAAAPPDSPSASVEAAAPRDAATERGRGAFRRGVDLSKAEQWGEALAAFEEAAAARDSALVQFNIAYCQRALGHYVAAREATRRILINPAGLSPSQIEDTRAYLAELEKVLVEARVTLDPPTATLTVDGRPLVRAKGKNGEFLADIAPAGEGDSPAQRELSVVLDPGVHLFRAARPGHHDAVVQRSYRPGDKANLDLRLDILPATISLESEPAAAIVRIDKREVGVAPIEFQRPAGRYLLAVEREGFVTYTATLDLQAGQRTALPVKLARYEAPFYAKWWFWTGAAAVVAGGAVLTYALTRPTPVSPPLDGGTSGWVAQGMRW